MIRGLLVVRPEPGNSRTAALLRERIGTNAGLDVAQLPLFAVHPVAWTAPDPAGFDALLLTSANAIRHGGPGLAALLSLPVVAVGERTAAAAARAGFTVAAVGEADADAACALARARGFARLLRLAGRDHAAPGNDDTRIVYASDPVPIAPGALAELSGSRLALLHSARAARRLAELVDRDRADRSRIGLVALSPAIRAAAGEGWAIADASPRPTDGALVTLALTLAYRQAQQRAIDRLPDAGDKRP